MQTRAEKLGGLTRAESTQILEALHGERPLDDVLEVVESIVAGRTGHLERESSES